VIRLNGCGNRKPKRKQAEAKEEKSVSEWCAGREQLGNMSWCDESVVLLSASMIKSALCG
jgi:hypothetical protein